MNVLSEPEQYNLLRARPGPLRAYEEKPDPKNPRAYRSGFDFSEGGIQQMLDERLVDYVDPRNGRITLCTKNWIKQELETLDADWERINSARREPRPEMEGRHLNRRNYLRAKRRLMEEELRFLHKLLAEIQEKKKAKELARYSKPRHRIGNVRASRDGVPYWVDGRDVEKKGDEYFIPSLDISLDEYLAQVKAERKARLEEKQKRVLPPACVVCK